MSRPNCGFAIRNPLHPSMWLAHKYQWLEIWWNSYSGQQRYHQRIPQGATWLQFVYARGLQCNSLCRFLMEGFSTVFLVSLDNSPDIAQKKRRLNAALCQPCIYNGCSANQMPNKGLMECSCAEMLQHPCISIVYWKVVASVIMWFARSHPLMTCLILFTPSGYL